MEVGKKGSKSKTHRGDKNCTTKRGYKDYHRGGHDVKGKNKPYESHKKGKIHVRDVHPKKGQASRTHKGELDFTTKKSDKDFHEDSHDVRKKRRPYHTGTTPHGTVGRGKGKGDEAAERKPRQRRHHLEHEREKMNLNIRAYRIAHGVVPRTFSGEDGAGI